MCKSEISSRQDAIFLNISGHQDRNTIYKQVREEILRSSKSFSMRANRPVRNKFWRHLGIIIVSYF